MIENSPVKLLALEFHNFSTGNTVDHQPSFYIGRNSIFFRRRKATFSEHTKFSSMQTIKNILGTLLAFILGYAVMVVGLYLSQDLFFGGIHIGETKLWQVAIAGFGAVVSAFAGGFVAGKIAPVKTFLPQIILAGETVIESIYLYLTGVFTNPLWFDILSELTLMVGIVAGGYYYLNVYRKDRQPKTT